MISALPTAAPARLVLALAQVDTVFVVQREPGWQTWIEALAAVATIVVALALLMLGFGVIFAGLKVRQLVRKVEEQSQKLRVDLAPAIHNVTAVTENANFVSKTLRADVDRLSATVTSANESLRRASVEAERRVGEFNALIGVVQEEAETLFIGAAAALRGLKAGTETFRRFQTGELAVPGEEDAFDDEGFGDGEPYDDELEGDEGEDELEIRVTRRDRRERES